MKFKQSNGKVESMELKETQNSHRNIPNWLRTLITGIATVLVCISLLTVTALIPKSLMLENWVESSNFFTSHELFDRFIGDQLRTMRDNFSDCNIWNIMLYTDSKAPLQSSLEARFYQPEGLGMNYAYAMAMTEYLYDEKTFEENYVKGDFTLEIPDNISGNLPNSNKEYARYWHGTMVYLRPLSVFMNITQIRILMGIIIVICFAVTSFLLWQKKMKAEAVLIWFAWFFLQGWMLFTSLENSTAFVWTAIFSLSAVIMSTKKRPDQWMPFFVLTGIVTAFVDFLTTETLTLTMPLLLLMLIYRKDGRLEQFRLGCKNRFSFLWNICFKNILTWGCGYAGMYSLKWGLIYFIMGPEVFKSSISEGFFRAGGTVYLGNSNLFDQATLLQQYQGAIWHNLAMLFPFDSEISYHRTLLCFGLVCLCLFVPVYLFRSKIDWKFYGLLSLVGVIPFIRFLLLSNHAYVHFFFTYRALYPTLMIAFLFVWENGIPRDMKKSQK